MGFEPAIPASERPQTYALDHATTGTACICFLNAYNSFYFISRIMYRFFGVNSLQSLRSFTKFCNLNQRSNFSLRSRRMAIIIVETFSAWYSLKCMLCWQIIYWFYWPNPKGTNRLKRKHTLSLELSYSARLLLLFCTVCPEIWIRRFKLRYFAVLSHPLYFVPVKVRIFRPNVTWRHLRSDYLVTTKFLLHPSRGLTSNPYFIESSFAGS